MCVGFGPMLIISPFAGFIQNIKVAKPIAIGTPKPTLPPIFDAKVSHHYEANHIIMKQVISISPDAHDIHSDGYHARSCIIESDLSKDKDDEARIFKDFCHC